MARPNKERVKIPRLDCLYINPTRYCNLKCSHCWVAPPHTDKKSPEGLDLKILKKSIAEAKKLGLSMIKITGGEPLLYGDLVDLIRFAKSKMLGVQIETNGTLVDREAAMDLAKLGIDFISVSLDGNSKVYHDRMRGVKGSFDLAVQGLRRLLDAKLSTQVIFTLSKDNRETLFEMPDFAASIGTKSLKINLLQPIARGKRLLDNGLAYGIEQHIDIYRRFERRFLTDPSASPLPIYYDMPFAFMDLKAIQTRNDFGRCNIHNILGILSDGKVSICGIGFVKNNLVFGDIGRQSIREIWTGSKLLKKIREDIPDNLEGICSLCFFKMKCRGRCVALSYYTTGKHNQSYYFCEEAFKKGLFPKTRMVDPKGIENSKLDLFSENNVADL